MGCWGENCKKTKNNTNNKRERKNICSNSHLQNNAVKTFLKFIDKYFANLAELFNRNNLKVNNSCSNNIEKK